MQTQIVGSVENIILCIIMGVSPAVPLVLKPWNGG